MGKLLLLILASGAALLNIGCSSSGDITDITQSVKRSTMSNSYGFVTASQQNASVSGYSISSTLGDWASSPIITKSPQGYTVYSSVQGGVISESNEETVILNQ